MLDAMMQIVFPLRKAWEFWRVIFRVLVAPLVKVGDVSSVCLSTERTFPLCFHARFVDLPGGLISCEVIQSTRLDGKQTNRNNLKKRKSLCGASG